MSGHDPAKRAAGDAAIALVEDGMALGLGSGSTVWFCIELLGERLRREGLRVRCVPTSVATERHATALGIPLVDLSAAGTLDLAIDGADEVERGSLHLIKGLGGALLREKIIAEATRRFVVIADDSKVVRRLGTHVPLPVEVVPFGHEATARRLPGRPGLRRDGTGQPFVTDNGNLIYDCGELGPAIDDPEALGTSLHRIAGVVEHGLFLSHAERAIIGQVDGTVRVLRGTR